jgi:hypothetical protein
VASAAELERECEVFARNLTGGGASDYLLRKYREAHERGVLGAGSSAFDRSLVAVARRGTWWARLADAHARLCASGGLLRRKLVLVLALLEYREPERVDGPVSRSPAGACLRAAWLGASFALLAGLAALLFLPLRVACHLFGGSE